MAEFEKDPAPLEEVGPRQSPDAYACGALSLCSRELLPAEVSPS
jgi:hypothetical protein